MKVAVFTSIDKKGASDISKAVIKKLLNLGAEVLISEKIGELNCTVLDENKLFKTADVVISVGGDGTLIGCAKKAAENGAAVLGINAGRLGFLTDIESENLHLLEKLVANEYKTENRMMIRVEVIEDDKVIYTSTALNDVIISGADTARIADIEATVGSDIISYRADGIVISTPTGSTAYSMSAGGPIIDPSIRCFNLTPICSHSLTARPILINAEDNIKIKTAKTSRTETYLAVDGIRYGLITNKQEVVIKICEFDAKLINISGKTIFKTLSMKF